ncbi:hypothetical protein BJX64DRAFT_293642 [Aspergillus heterothallicus]
MRVTRIAGLLHAVVLVGTGLATPLRRPLSVPNHVQRADTSSDPSCPDGFFCRQQSCSDDVKCPSGEECLNFEGHFACAPQGLKWCPLNPTSLEAVGCGDGSCCHGQCYSSAAVCCDFPTIKCAIGKACNVCSPDEKCGDNQCVDSNPTTTTTRTTTTTSTSSSTTTTTTKTAVPPSASTTTTTTSTTTKVATSSTTSGTTSNPSTTTSTTTTKTASTTTTTTTAPTSTTAKPTTSTTTTTTKSSTSSTSTVTTTTTFSTAPIPTVIDSIGSFSFKGCYEDTPDTRVLIADSSEQQGSDGMTVEKCIALAQEGAWRYAGVEYSYQCFVGNTIHDGNFENKGDCNTACAGNTGEACGGGNRIQIYEDSKWADPTLDELADAIRKYNATVVEARAVLESYNEHLQTLQDIMASSSSKTKRADGPYVNIEMQITGDRSAANTLVESSSERLLTLGRRLDTFDSDHPSVSADALEDFIATARMIVQQINLMILDAERTLVALAQAAIDNLPPSIDIAASLKTLAEGIAAVGEPVGPATGATGAFLVLAYLLSLFVGDGSGDDHTTTLAPTTTTIASTTTTTTTTTTTSSCTATATPTTIIVFTKQGSSVSDYDELFMYVGEMDQCTAEALDDNPLVDSWAIDADLEVEDFDTDETSTTAKRSMRNETNTDERSDYTRRGNPTAQSDFFQQAKSPSHLQWLSQVSRYTALTGNYYSFDDLVYNDPDFTIGPPPIIYIDLAGRVMDQLAVDDLGLNIVPQTAPASSHGTCMATLAAGSYSGMGKKARITHDVRCSRAFFLLMRIWLHAVNNNAQGNAVVSMSFGVPKDRLKWNSANPNSRNVFDTVLDWYWIAGISAVASAGNDETSDHNANYKDLSSSVPRGVGGRNTDLIVVGNSNWDTSRYRSSNYRDAIR